MSDSQAQPAILRLIHGEPRDRAPDAKPRLAAVPMLPPGVVLSVAESQLWDYLMAHVYQPSVHSSGDGVAFLKVARLVARVNETDEQLRVAGMLGSNARVLHPLARLSRDLWQQLGPALAEIGATPLGRVRLAGPRHDPAGGAGDSWGSID